MTFPKPNYWVTIAIELPLYWKKICSWSFIDGESTSPRTWAKCWSEGISCLGRQSHKELDYLGTLSIWWVEKDEDLGSCCALDRHFVGLFLVFTIRHQYYSCPQHAMVPICTPSFRSSSLSLNHSVSSWWSHTVFPLHGYTFQNVLKHSHLPNNLKT